MAPRHKRKSGGQPGNQNSRTHGFYSKFLSPEERIDVGKAVKIEGVDMEIALARRQIKSILQNAPQNYDLLLRAFSNFRSLMRNRKQLDTDNDRKFGRAVEYILRDTAALVGLSHSNQAASLLKNESDSSSTESASLVVTHKQD